jgi:hypothetical protein
MEERIISYEENCEIKEIISKMNHQQFLLTEHKTKTKQLYFKKFSTLPEIIMGEE